MFANEKQAEFEEITSFKGIHEREKVITLNDQVVPESFFELKGTCNFFFKQLLPPLMVIPSSWKGPGPFSLLCLVSSSHAASVINHKVRYGRLRLLY